MALWLHWSTLPLLLYLLGGYTIPLAIVVSALVFGIPSLRRRRVARVVGWVSIAIGATCPLGGALFLAESAASKSSESMSEVRRTRHLSHAETFFGTEFSAGSTVLIAEKGDAVESGTLSQPAFIRGLPLVGQFSDYPEHDGTPPGASGTLAVDAIVNTAPCAGKRGINYNPTFVSCTLAHDLLRDGFHFAAGTFLILRKRPGNGFGLEQGALAEPTQLFGTVYPAHTILAPGYWSLDPNAPSLAVQYAQLPGPEQTGIQTLCLTSGTTVTLEGAVLHGPMQIGYTPDQIEVASGCNYQLSEDDNPAKGDSGYGLLGTKRFLGAVIQPSKHAWTFPGN